MKKETSATARRIILALTLAGFIAIPVTRLRAQSSESISSDQTLSIETLSQEDLREAFAQIKQAQGQRLEGSWVVTVTPVVPPGVPQPPSFRTYASFARGGASIGSDRTRPFASPQHGTWAHIRGDEFATTSIQDVFDVMGNFQGTLTVRTESTLIGKDESVGVATAESRDAAGNLISSRCATIRRQRIKIEPLAPQCQGIPLPQ